MSRGIVGSPQKLESVYGSGMSKSFPRFRTAYGLALKDHVHAVLNLVVRPAVQLAPSPSSVYVGPSRRLGAMQGSSFNLAILIVGSSVFDRLSMSEA